MTEQQAIFDILNCEKEVDEGFFKDNFELASTYLVANYLKEQHSIDHETAWLVAEAWAYLPENKEYFGFE